MRIEFTIAELLVVLQHHHHLIQLVLQLVHSSSHVRIRRMGRCSHLWLNIKNLHIICLTSYHVDFSEIPCVVLLPGSKGLFGWKFVIEWVTNRISNKLVAFSLCVPFLTAIPAINPLFEC